MHLQYKRLNRTDVYLWVISSNCTSLKKKSCQALLVKICIIDLHQENTKNNCNNTYVFFSAKCFERVSQNTHFTFSDLFTFFAEGGKGGRVSLCSPRWPRTCYIDQDGSKLVILLNLSSIGITDVYYHAELPFSFFNIL